MLHFPVPTESQSVYGQTLLSWGNPTPMNKVRAIAALSEVREWSKDSKTAQRVLKFVEGSSKRVSVVAFERGGETVFSSDDPRQGEGTVFWNLALRLATKQGDGSTAPLHNFVALLHELGHALQWIENPVFFEGNVLHGANGKLGSWYGPAGERAIADAAKSFWMNKAKRQGLSTYKQQTDFAKTNMSTGGNRLSRPAWNVRVEMDNLMRHEWPICDEMRIARRAGYTDLVMM